MSIQSPSVIGFPSDFNGWQMLQAPISLWAGTLLSMSWDSQVKNLANANRFHRSQVDFKIPAFCARLGSGGENILIETVLSRSGLSAG